MVKRSSVVWFAVLCAAACGGEAPIAVSPIKSVTVVLALSQITVGSTAQATATLVDAKGLPVTDRPPTWSSLTPSVVSVSAAGLVTGLQAGAASVRATSGSVSGDASIVVVNPVAASISLSVVSDTLFVPRGALQVIAAVKDANGQSIQSPTIFWQSSAPLIASVSATGLVTAIAAGSATISASIDGQTAQHTLFVKVAPTANAPVITSITPTNLLKPGGTYQLIGTGFGTTIAANSVVVDGVPVTVTAATATQLSITLPVSGFSCEPSRSAFVQVTVAGVIGGGSATLQTATLRNLAPSQSVIVSTAAEVRCNELEQTGGRYVVSVYNASRSSVTPSAPGTLTVTIRGATALTSSAAAATVRPAAPVLAATATRRWNGDVPLIGSAAYTVAEEMRRARLNAQSHAMILQRSLDGFRNNPPVARSAIAAQSVLVPAGSPRAQVTTVGAVTSLKVPDLDATNFCVTSKAVNVRTVYVGAHAIIVEDTASVFNGAPTLQGQMNSYFQQVGQEFDTIMWPILTANFGNPLAADAQLSNTGKIIMVFTPKVNAMVGGTVLGYVVNCDFNQVSQSPSSNVGEYFYAVVPTSSAAAYSNPNTKDSWLRLMRATIIHETKHITAFGTRLLTLGLPLEELAWEEGMARTAEELYARTFYGTQAKANTGYVASLYCDLRFNQLSNQQCFGRPLLMLRAIDNLYNYFGNSEQLTPLGRPFGGEGTFYGSAWSVERWANDLFGTSESQFLKDWMVSPVTGVLNLEARNPGHSWDEMMGEWSLAMYLDDASGFSPTNPHLRFLSWNIPDLFAGMSTDVPGLYARANPFNPHLQSFGNFGPTNVDLVGGGVAYFEIAGAQSTRQLFEIRSFTGGDPPSTIRVAIVRVQ